MIRCAHFPYHIFKVVLTTVWPLRSSPSSSDLGIWQGPTPTELRRSHRQWRQPLPTSKMCGPHLSPHRWVSQTSLWQWREAQRGLKIAAAHTGPVWPFSQMPCSLKTCVLWLDFSQREGKNTAHQVVGLCTLLTLHWSCFFFFFYIFIAKVMTWSYSSLYYLASTSKS